MSDSKSADQVEFIRLNGHAVRVTSWRPGDDSGTFTLVAMTRGSRDAEVLDGLLSETHLTLEVGDSEPTIVSAHDVDRRTVGTGESGITRFSVVLTQRNDVADDAAASPTASLEERVAALEAEMFRLRGTLLKHANGVRH